MGGTDWMHAVVAQLLNSGQRRYCSTCGGTVRIARSSA